MPDCHFCDRRDHQRHPVVEEVGPINNADAAAVAAADEGREVDGGAVAEVEVEERRGGRVDEDAAAAADVVGVEVGEAAGEGEA